MNTAQGSLLIVDDDRQNRLLLAARLQSAGHVTAMAENGRQALERLRAQPFDLVLLDLLMPEMDGYQVLAQWLESVSRAGEVGISEATYREIAGHIAATKLEPVYVKNRVQPVHVYTVQVAPDGKA
jgi:CheY-like chemotaxis protein